MVLVDRKNLQLQMSTYEPTLYKDKRFAVRALHMDDDPLVVCRSLSWRSACKAELGCMHLQRPWTSDTQECDS